MVLGGKIAVSLYLQPIRKTVRFRMRQRLSTDLTAEERQEEKPRRGIPEVVIGNFAETSRRVQTVHFSVLQNAKQIHFPHPLIHLLLYN